jgi:TolB-like protein/Tfp pilus assembly protein PilF
MLRRRVADEAPMTKPARFSMLKELRRRHVFRVAGLYIVGMWLLMQAANILFPAWNIPDAAIQYLLWAGLLGFPVALVFGWIFEITPGGIRRTRPAASQAELAASLPLRGTDYLILSALALVVALIIFDAAGRVLGTAPDEARWTPAAALIENSVAVLPFTNLSDDPQQAYLSDGISEEILNRLSAFSELKVIARTSSFALRDSGHDISRISALLGVQYLLQGSVRRDEQQLRISAQLVASNGVQVWSSSFDRPLGGIFALQDEIAEAVALSIVPHISRPAHKQRLPDLEAYQHYLMGREKMAQRAVMFWHLAAEEFTRAITLDPEFAAAYADRATVLTMGAVWTQNHEGQYARAQRDIDTALALRPDLAQGHAAQAILLRHREPDAHAEVEALLRAALALDPNQADALNWLSISLGAQGRHAEAMEVLERAARLDPLSPSINSNLALWELRRGQFADAERRLLRLLEIRQPMVPVYIRLLELHSATGRLENNVELGKRVMLSLAAHTGRAAGNFGLVQAYAELGMRDLAEYWGKRFDQDHPTFYLGRAIILRTLAIDTGLIGYDDALGRLQDALDAASVNLEQVPDDVRSFYGALHSLAGHHEIAVRILEPLVDANAPLRDAIAEAFVVHALAHALLEAGHQERAARLLRRHDLAFVRLHAEGKLELSSEQAMYALNTLMLGDAAGALDLLERAERAGWRRYYSVLHDPRWNAVRKEPRYQAIMARVKADIDAQRRRVEVIEAEDDFAARLDAAIAAAAVTGGDPR